MLYLHLPATLTSRYLAVRAMSALCRALKQPDAFIDAVVSSVGEAFNNAVIHGVPANECDESEDSVEIEISLQDQTLEIRVLDYGRGFSLSDVPLFDLDVDPLTIDELPECGMGLCIIRGLMSQVEYDKGRPNVLSMRKDLLPMSLSRRARSAAR